MSQSFINYDLLREFPAEGFAAVTPFPWADLQQFLAPEGFRSLYESFPSLDLFEQHSGIERVYGQKPHDRYYLAYEKSIYHDEGERPARGVLTHDELPPAWRSFVEEIESGGEYARFVRRALGVGEFETRYAWHVGFTNSEVSPHVDSPTKYGTHIVYFNTSEDWDAAWGGATLVLGGKKTAALNPDFDDFASAAATRITDNHSFLFKNTPGAWHGVRPLACPPGSYRRLFNIIFEAPGRAEVVPAPDAAAGAAPVRGLIGRLKGAVSHLRK
jgi:hypothetical protein